MNKEDSIVTPLNSPRTVFNDYWLKHSSKLNERHSACKNFKSLNQSLVTLLKSSVKKVRFNHFMLIFEFETQ